MKIKQAALAIACVGLVVVILGCFAAQIYQQKSFSYSYQDQPCKVTVHSGIASFKAVTIDQYCMLAFPPTDGTAVTSASSVNATRTQIFNFISENPGVQFRAICAGLCLPVGLVQYYVAGLVKSGLISFVRDGRYKRFFVAKRYSTRQMLTICMLRHKTARQIVEVLLCKKQLSHGRLACEVSVTSQGLTWQMKTLKNTPFIACTNEGLKTIYCLDAASAPLLQECLAALR